MPIEAVHENSRFLSDFGSAGMCRYSVRTVTAALQRARLFRATSETRTGADLLAAQGEIVRDR